MKLKGDRTIRKWLQESPNNHILVKLAKVHPTKAPRKRKYVHLPKRGARRRHTETCHRLHKKQKNRHHLSSDEDTDEPRTSTPVKGSTSIAKF